MITNPLRFVALGAGITTVALGIIAAPALSISPVSPASAATITCNPGYSAAPNLRSGATASGTDGAVNVYAAGDFTTSDGAAEGEGVFVVGGDATFADAYFNLGVVGVGSRMDPPAMSDMLTAGGDVTVASGTLEVGHNVGGNIVSGGTVGPTADINTNGGAIVENDPSPLAAYASVATYYDALSTEYSALPATGTVVVDGWQVTFTGDNTSSRQVFSVSGDDLGALGAANTKTMVFTDIPDDAVIIVNVTGTTATLSANTFQLNGTTIDPVAASPDRTFSHLTQSMLWNFTDATDVTLGDGDQLLGSVLVPNPASSVELLTSTNGRVYVGGDLTFGGGSQTGLEMHNYSFRAPTPCVIAAEGTISIGKTLVDTDSVVDPTRTFTGTYSCVDSSAAVVANGTWSTRAGDSFVTPAIPAGSECSVMEDALTTAPSADDSYSWKPPAISPATVTVPDSATPVAVTVTNEVQRAVGGFAMQKTVSDAFGVVDPARVYSGTFSCDYKGVDVTPAPGTWSTTAGAPALTLATELPAGTECALTENVLVTAPDATSDRYVWKAPVFSAASVTIADDATAIITVTNTVGTHTTTDVSDDDDSDDGGDTNGDDEGTDGSTTLASTGSDVALPLGLAGATLAIGAGLLVFARRRQLRNTL